jgi:hypothetical protein
MFGTQTRRIFWLAGFSTLLAACLFVGCERKERVVDIEAPGVDVEVDRNVDTGEVEVNANSE